MSAPAMAVRICIVDHHPIFREGLRVLLEEDSQFLVVGETSEGSEAVQLASRTPVDVVLLCATNHDGIEFLQQLPSEIRTILLTSNVDNQQTTEAIRLGIRGVVLKETGTAVLMKCIRAVAKGDYWIGNEQVPDITRFRTDPPDLQKEQKEKEKTKTFNLTPREMETLAAVVAGKTNKEIAKQFVISEQTVKHHITHIFDKVGVYNRLELVLFAIHHGLVGSVSSATSIDLK